MKFLLLSIFLLSLACQPSKNKNKDSTNPTISVVETDKEIASYETLTVTDIQYGKDGYTATLNDDHKGLYTCTISIPNLGDNYINLKVGDQVKIAGEYAESHPIQIFAKRILIVN